MKQELEKMEPMEKLKRSALAGGLTESEAQDYASTDLSVPEELEEDGRKYEELPIAVGYLEENNWEDPYNRDFDGAQDFADHLIERIDDRTITNAKQNEYIIRALYTLSGSLNQEQTDELVYAALGEADDAAALAAGQYIGEIEEVAGEEALDMAYSVIEGYGAAERLAAANLPIEDLPDSIEGREFEDFDAREVGEDELVTRMRGMKTAGGCSQLEPGHVGTFLDRDSEYHRKNTLVTMEGEPVGSVKGVGNQSMMALQDIKSDGKILMEKGWAYEVSYRVLNQRENTVPSIPEQGWNTLEVDRLEVMPMRPAGARGDRSPEEFCREIDEMMAEIELE